MNALRKTGSLRFMYACICLLGNLASAYAASDSLSTEAIINVPLAEAWQLFSSEAGLQSLGYAQTNADLQLGGAWQASGGTMPLPRLNGQIISFDPQHMLSIKPYGVAANDQWTVLYFTAMGKQMTQLRWLEFFSEPQRAAVVGNQQQVRRLFDQLIRRYAPECEVCKAEREKAAEKNK